MCNGTAEEEALVTTQPISFVGGVWPPTLGLGSKKFRVTQNVSTKHGSEPGDESTEVPMG